MLSTTMLWKCDGYRSYSYKDATTAFSMERWPVTLPNDTEFNNYVEFSPVPGVNVEFHKENG